MAIDSVLQVRMDKNLKAKVEELSQQEIDERLARSIADRDAGRVVSQTTLDEKMLRRFGDGNTERV